MKSAEDVIEALIRRFVPQVNGVYDSVCLPEVNEAFRRLAGTGRFKVTTWDGNRMKGRFVTERERRLELVARNRGLRQEDAENR